MSLADFIIIILLVLFAFSGIRRGAVWELLTALGLGLGFALTYYYREEIMNLVVDLTDPGWQRQWGGGIIFLLFFMIVYAGFTTLGHHLHQKIERTPFKYPDRVLGSVAGLLKGILLIALLVMATDWLDMQGDVRRFLWQSKLIHEGKRMFYNLTHWESPSQRQWVMLEEDAEDI
jgi:membrane protein required for colicin V production